MKTVRVLAIAYAATALVVFLQSIVLRAIAYDSPWFDRAALIVRLAFFVADVTTFVAIFVLARREVAARGFTAVAALMSGYAVLSGLLTMAMSSQEAFVGTTSAVEETMSFAASILVGLALAAIAKDRDKRLSRVAIVSFIVTTALVAVVRLARSTTSEARTIPIAWLAWALHVAQPATLVALALPLVRTPNGAARSDAPELGGYRGGPAAIATDAPKPRAEDVPPDPSTIGLIDTAVRGLTLYRGAFLARIISMIVFVPLFIIVAEEMRGAEALVGVMFLPLAGSVSALIMTVGVLRLRALPSLRGGVLGVFTVGAFFIAALTDVLAILGALGSSRRGGEEMIALAIPSSAFFVALGITFLVRILGAAGEQLGQDALARSSRWAQALIVFFVTAFASAIFGSTSTGYHYGHGRDAATALVIFLLFAAFGAAIAVVVQQIKLIGETLRILRTRLALAPRIGSPPGS